MTVTEETLMAFADGELDAAQAEAVEQAMREDPAIEARIARHRALRQRLRVAYTSQLDEPVPERLLAAARSPAARVVDLRDARAARAQRSEAASAGSPSPVEARLWWRPLGSLAASLLVGVAVGYALFREAGAPFARGGNGALAANAVLARTLSQQLAADQDPGAPVRVGVSFRNHAGQYCRSFALAGTDAPAGIACRAGDAWLIKALGSQAPAGTGGYRTAASALSPALLKVIEDDIDGETLDAAAEARALSSGWHQTR